jgi:hypothetical protein
VDARDVQDRLDAVCGAGGWALALTPLSVEGGELRVAPTELERWIASRTPGTEGGKGVR